MQKNKMRIPAILKHEVDGVLYRVNGIITDINESNNTCSMKFKGYPVFNGIPMDSIYLNEAFLDKVKEYGKKAWEGIKKLVKAAGGFLFPTNEDGEPDMQYLYNPINIAIAATKTDLPVTFYPASGMVATAEANGIRLPHAGENAWDACAEEDTKSIETYWARVMKTYAKNESMDLSDAVRFVNENYYKTKEAALNEASTLSLGNVIQGQYGVEMGTYELVDELISNIMSQLKGTPGHHSKTKPLLIWGAPGIGKTAIIKEVLNILKEDYSLDLNIMHLACGSVFRDDFVIPATEQNKVGQEIAVDVNKLWLPVYYPAPDPQVMAERDHFYNTGKFKFREKDLTHEDGTQVDTYEYDGGIIFLDEFMRMPPQSQNIIMNVVNEHVYNGMVLASKWGWVLASNRAFDVLSDEKSEIWEPAMADRYTSVTFVPTRKEWLEWARSKNKTTGRQNVDEMFCNFIEHSPMGVWYDALKFGSRNDKLTQDEINTLDGSDYEQMQQIQKESNIALDKITWTPRTWAERVNEPVMDMLQQKLFPNNSAAFEDCFNDQGNLDSGKLQQHLKEVPENLWERFRRAWANRLDPNDKLNRYAFVMKWISFKVAQATGEDNLPAREWNNYNNFRSTFTTDVINSIWETGTLGSSKLIKDDDLYFNTPGQYETTQYSKWKKNSSLADEVTTLIINGFPGGDAAMEKLLKKELPIIASALQKRLTPAEHKKLFDKYSKEYSVKIGAKTIPLLYKPEEFNGSGDTESIMQQASLITLDNSEFARMYSNVALYIAKFSMQMHADNKLGELCNEMFCGWFQKHCKEDAVKRQTIPIAALNNAGRNSEAEQIATSLLVGYPASIILNNAMYRDKDFAANGTV